MSRILAFTGQQASRLTGLSPRVLRYWEQTDVYSASYVDERPRVPYRRIYSFRDVVSLRTLALLRKEHHVKLDDLRRTGRFLRETYPDRSDPWSELRFGLLNGRVVFRDPETGTWLTATPPGQTILPIDVAEIARATEQEAAQFIERRPEDVGVVVRQRYVLGNAWRLAGTRIPTSAVWHFHEDGADAPAIRRAYPDLADADVAAAIDHERRRRGRSVA
jgi:DNA-binding transcriptional MerR regulator